MTKAELVKHIAAACAAKGKYPLTDKAVETVLDGAVRVLQDILARGGRVRLPGLGTFETVGRAARQARNPRTGEAIQIPARRGVHFSAAKELKDAVNGAD